MKRYRIITVAAALLVVGLGAAFYLWRTHGLEAMAVAGAVPLDGALARLRSDFNADQDKVRLLFIVGPSCGTCLMGMENLNRELVGKLQGDIRFKTFVVHVPALMATAADVPGAMRLMSGPDVIHYWDGDARSGVAYAKVLNVSFAWDVWMAYAPGQTWDDPAKPPAPAFWRHQLRDGPPGLELDAAAFAVDAINLAPAP
jgi:hypothetical protein